jgi:SPP1 family predicted phage head-tail adaptor
VLSRRGAGDPGRLRLRLALEKPTPVPDGAGGVTITWDVVATIAADLVPQKADERGLGEGVADLTLYRIVIRYRADVASGDRFRFGERLFRIRSVTDADEDSRYLVCIGEEEGRP